MPTSTPTSGGGVVSKQVDNKYGVTVAAVIIVVVGM